VPASILAAGSLAVGLSDTHMTHGTSFEALCNATRCTRGYLPQRFPSAAVPFEFTPASVGPDCWTGLATTRHERQVVLHLATERDLASTAAIRQMTNRCSPAAGNQAGSAID
jgi:hypothetical protein